MSHDPPADLQMARPWLRQLADRNAEAGLSCSLLLALKHTLSITPPYWDCQSLAGDGVLDFPSFGTSTSRSFQPCAHACRA